jgi:hypothetical protein
MVAIRPSLRRQRIRSELARKAKEERVQRQEFVSKWITIYQNRDLKILGFEKVLEDILGCKRIKENPEVEVYRCTVVTPGFITGTGRSLRHSFHVTVYKNMKNPKALVSLGNLPEPMLINYPLDLLNAYYIVGKWNEERDKAISAGGMKYFEEHKKEMWNWFKKEMEEEGIPVDPLERRKLGITLYVPEKVMDYVAKQTRKTIEEIKAEIDNLPDEIFQQTMTLGALFKQKSFRF